jgi:hypothetical protein
VLLGVLCTALLLVVVAPGVAHASGYVWSEGDDGGQVLETDEGGHVKTWTPAEWDSWKKEIEASGECLERVADCAKHVAEGDTKMASVGSGPELEAGERVAVKAREAGADLGEAKTGALDEVMSDTGGALDLASAAGTLGALALTPTVFKLGVKLGNDLDEVFGFPKWDIEGDEKKVEEAAPDCHLENFEHTSAWRPLPEDSPAFPVGYYVHCAGVPWVKESSSCRWNTGVHTDPPPCPGPGDYGDFGLKVAQTSRKESEKGGEEEILTTETAEYEPSPECLAQKDPAKPCGPVGVPRPLSPGDEAGLANAGALADGHASFDLPGKGTPKGELVGRGALRKFTEDPVKRKAVEEVGEETPQEMVTEDYYPEIKEIPAPLAGESAVGYVHRLEEIGFHEVSEEVLPEPVSGVGPGEVAKVDPAPGTQAYPENPIKVEGQPGTKEEPKGGGETGGYVGPKPPGIDTPDFAVLCTRFPFGIPCWIVKTVEKWSAAAVVPSFDVPIYRGKMLHIDLAEWEGAMEIIRPVFYGSVVLSIIFMFVNWAWGSRIAPGEQGESDGAES